MTTMGRPRHAERIKRDCTHVNVKHQHGDVLMYINDGCRCTPCTDANSAYVINRRKQIAYGRWGTHFTDAQPIRDHVEQLRAQGMGLNTIAARSGVSKGALSRLIYGEPAEGCPPSKRLLNSTANQILSVKPELDLLADGAMIDATGTRRRLQALVAIGWTQKRLSRELDCTPQHISYLLHYRGKTTAANAKRIRSLYDRLWDQLPVAANKWEQGGIRRALDNAGKHGWAVPLAWDDDTINDPNAQPDLGDTSRHVNTGRPAEDVAEDVEFVLDNDPLLTVRHIADRLGVTNQAIQHALKRAQRQDLLDLLARNARLAKEGTTAA